MVGVCPLSQSADEKHNPEKKPTYLCAPRKFPPKCILSCNLVIATRINKTFVCSRCLICILDSGHFISTPHAKDSWLFHRNYPQINEVGKFDQVDPNLVPRPLCVLLLRSKKFEKALGTRFHGTPACEVRANIMNQ